MTIKTEGIHPGEFLLSEANGTRSRQVVVITAGSGVLRAGTLISKLTAANALTPAANVGNTGTGTIGAAAVTSLAVTGDYLLKITEAAANGGAFEVYDPVGVLVGGGEVGQPFAGGGISFTLADGATDFVVGDGFTLAVVASLGEWTAYDDAGTDDGRRTADGILFASVDAMVNDVEAVAITADAEVIQRLLTGIDANGAADLAALGIVIRP